MSPLRSEDETREKEKWTRRTKASSLYISADKVLPEFTVTSILMGIILAVVFGAANAYLGLKSWYDCICFYSGSSYFHGRYPRHYEKGFNP